MTLLKVDSETGIVAACDPSCTLPSGLDQEALVRELEATARSGRVFYLVTDDPIRCRIELLADEPPPATLGEEFEPAGGTFGLDLPSGTLVLHGWSRAGDPEVAGSIGSAPGAHVLSVLTRRPFDGSRHEAEMAALLGADWGYTKRVDKLALIGCLPLALTALIVIGQRWHLLWYAVPLLAVLWLPHLVLRRARRYQQAERRMSEHEQARPHFVIRATPTTQSGLAGGFLRV